MHKKIWALMLAFCMTAVVMGGCGGQQAAAPAEEAVEEEAPEEAAPAEEEEAAPEASAEEEAAAETASDTAAEAATEAAAEAATEAAAETAAEKEAEVTAGTVTYNVDMTQYEKGKVVRVWLPVAQTNDYQTVDDDPSYDAPQSPNVHTEITTDELGNKMLYVAWDAETEPEDRTVNCFFHAERPEILAPEFKEEGSVEELEGYEAYLQPSSTVPVDGVVKEQADKICEGKETVFDKARAIYDWIYENMNRDEAVTGCGDGDVCALLDSKGGKCTDINSVFIGLCRAEGIPAREMFGIRMNAEDITKNQHCWTQFYLPGTGWVSADPADVLKAVLKNEWTKDSAEALECKEYYWGSCDSQRVELTQGRDVVLSPAQDGPALNNFGYPYAEVDGEAIDYYTPDAFVYTVSFEADAE